MKKGRVTGIGGIFFKSRNPKKIKQWYYSNLGLAANEYGSLFEYREGADPGKIAYAQWGPFKNDTTYFEPSTKEFMINFRVVNLNALIEEMRSAGIEITMEIETYEYGKFAHIMDPEGNKIELWEPVDEVFTKLYGDKTTK
jgi:predicted enzyme related to lactoylglutathione lyase